MKKLICMILILFSTQLVFSQSIVIDLGASIEVDAGADICAGVSGNITGNLFGEGTQCGQNMINTFQLSVSINDGWNMVSVPGINPDGQGVGNWWSGLTGTVYKYVPGAGYSGITTTTPGEGYWMKNLGAQTYNTGDEWPADGIQIVSHDPLNASQGWNLIGGYETSVSTAGLSTIPPGLIAGPIYKYSGGYQVASTLDPGYGYWIKLTGSGQIFIPDQMEKSYTASKDYFPQEWGKISLIDAAGYSFVLYAVKGKTELSQYDLPPSPPAGMFDIRFANGKIAEDLKNNSQIIEMNGITYPLVLSVQNIDIQIRDESGKLINAIAANGDKITINNALINKLIVTEDIIPKEYSLEQNYPNPFNPVTRIKYSIPENNFVSLKIYNTLAQEVSTLVNEEKQAGTYEINFDASHLASGVYIYKLEAGGFTAIKKLVLMK